jgi:hypothetical protein
VFTIRRPGKFNHPRGIACQRATRLVVVGDENDRLQVFRFAELPAPTLTYVSTFGRPSPSLPRSDAQPAKRDGGRSDALGFFRRPAGRSALGVLFNFIYIYIFRELERKRQMRIERLLGVLVFFYFILWAAWLLGVKKVD